MSNKVISPGKLSKLAPAEVGAYLDEAVRRIDLQLGTGTAKANPTLVGMFVLTCGLQYIGAAISGPVCAALEHIDSSICLDGDLGQSLESLCDTIQSCADDFSRVYSRSML